MKCIACHLGTTLYIDLTDIYKEFNEIYNKDNKKNKVLTSFEEIELNKLLNNYINEKTNEKYDIIWEKVLYFDKLDSM